MKYPPLPLLLALCMGMNSQHFAQAQSTATITVNNGHSQPPGPHLPTGGGDRALEAALVQSFHYPTRVQPQQVNGFLYVDIEVTQEGKITSIDFDRLSGSTNIPTSIDAAIRTTIRHLPTLVPARVAGQPVSAKLHMRWSFNRSLSDKQTPVQVAIEQPAPDLVELSGIGDKPREAFDPNTTYTYVEKMPRLPYGTGQTNDIIGTVQQALVLPATAQEGRIFVSFVVDKQGKVGEAKIVKGLDAVTDAAVLAAVRSLPTFLPGKQDNQLARVSFTLPISVYLPSKRPPVKPLKH